MLYMSVFVSVSVSGSASSTTYAAQIDSATMINLVHKSIVSFLGLTVQSHLGLLTTLADGKMVLLYSSYLSLSCTIAGVSYCGTFFVTLLRAQSIILGMRYLEWKNPVID